MMEKGACFVCALMALPLGAATVLGRKHSETWVMEWRGKSSPGDGAEAGGHGRQEVLEWAEGGTGRDVKRWVWLHKVTRNRDTGHELKLRDLAPELKTSADCVRTAVLQS